MAFSLIGTRGKSKPSAKYDECLTGDEIDSALLNIEPTKHLQCDGKINNVSFHIAQENIELWKSAAVNHFGEHNTSICKSGSGIIIKTVFNADGVDFIKQDQLSFRNFTVQSLKISTLKI